MRFLGIHWKTEELEGGGVGFGIGAKHRPISKTFPTFRLPVNPHTRAPWLAIALLALGLSACGEGERFDLGLDAGLRVSRGSFVRGELPEESGGPEVRVTYLGTSVSRAFQDRPFSGVLDPEATAVLVALEGDPGYWIVPSGFPFPEAPGTVSFDAPLSFSSEVDTGPHTLLVAGVDEDSRKGPVVSLAFTLVEQKLPEGELVISLFWDTESDLDLHVVTPDGIEIYRDRPNSFRAPPGTTPGRDDWQQGGLLDVDSNAKCVIDGRRNENVVFANPPPEGTYVVRVETSSLCGAPGARYFVEVRRSGELIAQASGFTTATATRFPHSVGAGVTVLEFVVEP